MLIKLIKEARRKNVIFSCAFHFFQFVLCLILHRQNLLVLIAKLILDPVKATLELTDHVFRKLVAILELKFLNDILKLTVQLISNLLKPVVELLDSILCRCLLVLGL